MSIFDNQQDINDLQQAITLLEAPSIAIQLANLVGGPIEWSLSKLPNLVKNKVQSVVHSALHKSVDAALYTMNDDPKRASSPKTHKLAAATSGAVSGFFGAAGLLIELPISTTIMMRSVADIARGEGFSLADLSVKAACVEVFALGGRASNDDAAESAYYASRAVLADITKHASRELIDIASKKGAEKASAKITTSQAGKTLARVIDAVATRLGITITEKMAAQIVPVIGAASGAAINTLFINHYQNMAKGHFIVKRLEQKYGEDEIKAVYLRFRGDIQPV
ncbi:MULTISPECIES: EcsC family protein [unclassified Brenneria]|uniref:EcsC family protein n=1 Tax=unclassified Brenneria TaxID=2634434 RepID=UPI0029C3D431|nr:MULTISPECIES: EcsC family protein [unclassified Brenneria]MDX5626991.1 EcsC family protein [Brenneria sp. L3-3Z]MDX5693659.1 EcsC family protein [Brenneria sp. L4-2C]MEE3661701.1 EcsC family protein [Brenneria sp. g21c3]